ncbi:thiopeptide-type bacteriocin biosynthesis protein [Kitasatospora sp. NPDC088346]|uniref:thiopeptide-type bacteriocin biosynthesis protein n=1 Tax=Kitasatospora sp. NPDC088346 TaxID=3364073 RepID=UPI00381A8226
MADRNHPDAPRYRAAAVAVLRIPALPADRYSELLAACPADDPHWPATHRALLAEAWRTPLLATAVEHTAPALARALTGPDGPADLRTALALDRCLNRLSTRPTPFGLAAAVTAVPFGPRPRLHLAGPARPVARPDAALRRPGPGAPEPDGRTLVQVSDLVHTPDGHPWREPAGPGAAHWLRGSGPALAVLRAAARPVPLADLVADLGRRYGTADPGPARRLVRELLRRGFLRTAGPELPAPGPLLGLCDRLNTVADPAEALDRLRTALRARPRPALHLDAVARPAGPAALDPAVARYAERAAAVLALIGRGSRYPAYLARAAAAFAEHYGDHARVPALEAVHTLTDLRALDADGPAAPDPRGPLLGSLVAEALAYRRPVRELDDELLARLGSDRPIDRDRPALPGVDVCLRIARTPGGGIRAAIAGPGAVPAGVAYGRATDLLDAPARAALRAAFAAEEAAAPGHRFVELRYRPEQAAAANVTARELWRPRQLTVDLPPAGRAPRLALAEVLVTVAGGRFELREAATGHLLHLTQASGLDLRLAPPVCRFLLDASANQFRHPAPFDWGPAGGGPFRPRLEHRGLVVSPARWRPDRRELGDCSARQVRDWADRWLAPRHLCLVRSGRQLLLDLDSAVSLAHLRHALDRADDAGPVLEEAVPAPGGEPVTGADGGRHALEAVVPVVLLPPAAPAPRPVPAPARRPAATRPGRPAADWLSLHLHLRTPWQDALLADLTARLPRAQLFFVRYADPVEHLRVRVRRQPGLLDELLDWAGECAHRLPLHDVAVRAYRPETDRYGGPELIGAAERLFCADSAAVAALLGGGAVHRPPPGLPPAALAALTLDRIAVLLLPDLRERRALAAAVADSRDGSLEHRAHGRDLWRLRAGNGAGPDLVAAHWAAPAAEYRRLLAEHWPGPAGARRRGHALASLLHLHANRLGLDRARERAALGLWRRLLDRQSATSATGTTTRARPRARTADAPARTAVPERTAPARPAGPPKEAAL